MHWSEIKEKSAGFFRLRFLLLIYKIFGRATLQIFIYPVIFFSVLSSKKLRAASYQYLQKIYLAKTPSNFAKPNIISVFKHVFSFALALIDKIESWLGSLDLDSLNIKTPEAYNNLLKNLENKKGVFLISSHLGNMELLRALGTLKTFKLLNRELKVNTIVQSNYTAHFNKLLNQVNKNSAINLISATNIDIEQTILLKDCLQNGEIVVISGDRTAQNNQNKNFEVNFLGEKANFPLGPFIMADIMKSPTYFIFCLKSPEQKAIYDLYFYEADMKLAESRQQQKENIPVIINQYVKYLEDLCLEYPNQWFNFFDFWQRKTD